MSRTGTGNAFWLLMSAIALILILGYSQAEAGGKVSLYGIRMVPDRDDAQEFSRPGWGGGLRVVVPVP